MTAAAEQPGGLDQLWTEQARLGHGPEGYLDMIDALRTLQDRVAVAVPPVDLIADITRTARDLSARLAVHAVAERDRISGSLADVPGRGQTLVPVLHLDEGPDDRVRGHVRFGQHYLGGNAAAHGGAIPLVFDDLLGRLAGTGGRSASRTAYLHVDYRSVTPLDTDLRIEAWFEHEEGRKRLLRGTLHHGDILCAEAEGLFVALRPGQP